MADDRRKKLLTDRAEVYDGLGGDAAPEGKLVDRDEAQEWLDWFREAHPSVVDDIAKAERERIQAIIERRRDHCSKGGTAYGVLNDLLAAIRGEA